MKEKDLQIELHLSTDSLNADVCKVIIINQSNEVISNPEIQFSLQRDQRIKNSEKFIATQDSSFVIGRFPAGSVIPAAGKYEFTIEVSPKITKENCPKNFLIGFPCGGEEKAGEFSVSTEWQAAGAEYRSCKVTLSNNTDLVLTDPMITFETIKDQTVTAVSGIDIQAKGEKALSLDIHEITFAEFSGSVADTVFAKGKREFTIGINRANSGKELKLPEHIWIGFEIATTALVC